MNNFWLGIDLSAVGEDYKGGVARYSLAVTKAIIENSQRSELKVSVICTKRNFAYIRRELGDVKFNVIINNNFGGLFYTKLHSLAYRLHIIPSIFFVIRAITSRSIKQLTKGLDLIYCPTTYLNFETGKCTVVSLHDTQEVAFPENFTKQQRNYRKLNRIFTLRHARMIQVSSEFVKKEIYGLSEYKNKNQEIHVIREGVDTNYFTFKQQYKIDFSTIVIAVPANFTAHKNQALIIDKLSKMDSNQKILVLFIGEGEHLEECRDQAARNISKNIDFAFLGKVSDEVIKEIYSSAHIVLSASSYESSSLPILEGLSSGSIAVASSIEAHLEMSEFYPIYIFDLESPEGLATCIREVISDVKTLMSVTSRLRRRSTVLSSDWNQIASEYLVMFQREESL